MVDQRSVMADTLEVHDAMRHLVKAQKPPSLVGTATQTSLDAYLKGPDLHPNAPPSVFLSSWIHKVGGKRAGHSLESHLVPSCAPVISDQERLHALPSFSSPPSPQASHADPHYGILALPVLPPSALRLLNRLEALPWFSPLTTVSFVPRSAVSQFSQIYAASFWFQHVALSCTEEHAKLFALLNFYIPIMLLFDDTANSRDDMIEEHPDAPAPSVAKDIVGRILLAEQGKWDLIIDNFIEAHRKLVAIREAAEPAQLTTKKKYELFCKKVLGQCYKAATSILEENNTPPDSVETFIGVQQL